MEWIFLDFAPQTKIWYLKWFLKHGAYAGLEDDGIGLLPLHSQAGTEWVSLAICHHHLTSIVWSSRCLPITNTMIWSICPCLGPNLKHCIVLSLQPSPKHNIRIRRHVSSSPPKWIIKITPGKAWAGGIKGVWEKYLGIGHLKHKSKITRFPKIKDCNKIRVHYPTSAVRRTHVAPQVHQSRLGERKQNARPRNFSLVDLVDRPPLFCQDQK